MINFLKSLLVGLGAMLGVIVIVGGVTWLACYSRYTMIVLAGLVFLFSAYMIGALIRME